MKVLVFCVCVSIFAFQLSNTTVPKRQLRNANRNLNNVFAICRTENKINTGDIYDKAELMANIHTKPGNEERTRKTGCFIACIMKKGNLTDGTNIKEKEVIEQLHLLFEEPKIVKPIVRKCLKEVRNITQECEKGFSMYSCITKSLPNVEESKKDDEAAEKAEENRPNKHI